MTAGGKIRSSPPPGNTSIAALGPNMALTLKTQPVCNPALLEGCYCAVHGSCVVGLLRVYIIIHALKHAQVVPHSLDTVQRCKPQLLLELALMHTAGCDLLISRVPVLPGLAAAGMLI